jgi:hypothetical protein
MADELGALWYIAESMALGIVVGRGLAGRWASVDGEAVRTRFFGLVVPLVPIETLYVIGSFQKPKRTLAARTSAASIAMAYLRWIVAPIVVALALFGSFFDAYTGFGRQHAVAIAGVFAGWAALAFLTGRDHGRRVAQRRLMKRYLGHAAAPEMLTVDSAKAELARLEEIWNAATAKDSPYLEGDKARPWREVYPKEVRNSLVALYYALSRYDAAVTGETVRTDRARLAWERLEGPIP